MAYSSSCLHGRQNPGNSYDPEKSKLHQKKSATTITDAYVFNKAILASCLHVQVLCLPQCLCGVVSSRSGNAKLGNLYNPIKSRAAIKTTTAATITDAYVVNFVVVVSHSRLQALSFPSSSSCAVNSGSGAQNSATRTIQCNQKRTSKHQHEPL
jgi:hypothetical protein